MPPIQKSRGSFPAPRGIPWHTVTRGMLQNTRGMLEKRSGETPIILDFRFQNIIQVTQPGKKHGFLLEVLILVNLR
jgi:hypothetical protein